ncbi:MAG: F0F1-type ATP synthase epsilon subunit [Candidatus Deianiraeaceae bacterium]|jgi:F0F1-type ATP synthase epsilon subunit
MAEQFIDLKIITRDGIRFNGKVSSITVPSLAGAITILAQHIPLLSGLKAGDVQIKNNIKTLEIMSIRSGFIRFINNTCIITIEESKMSKAS